MKLPKPRVEGSYIGGKIPALFTLLADVLKGFIPVILARMFCIDGFLLGLVGVFAVFGHMHPIFFKFKGGKGVATFFGVILALFAFDYSCGHYLGAYCSFISLFVRCRSCGCDFCLYVFLFV